MSYAAKDLKEREHEEAFGWNGDPQSAEKGQVYSETSTVGQDLRGYSFNICLIDDGDTGMRYMLKLSLLNERIGIFPW